MSYTVPFVGFKKQYQDLKQELDAAYFEIMENGDFILRRHLEEFERSIADYVGCKHAIGVNTGTDALYLCAHACSWQPGDEIITVAHTFVATVGSIAVRGATPVLIDVAEDYNMDVSQLEAAITPKTKAIIPVHLNGHPCDMDAIMGIAEKHKLTVIEDAAQALGASYKGKRCSSFGLAGIFSFYPAKMLGTAGDGGMVCTNDDAFARKIRALRDNGRVEDVNNIECYGYCSRLDNLHAALLSVKFKHFPAWVERRRQIASHYSEGLAGIPGLKIHPTSNGDYYDVYQNYVVRAEQRDELIDHLKQAGVETLVSWRTPMHHQKALGLDHFKLPMTETVSDEVISLPMFPELTNQQVQYVIDAVKKFYE